MSRLARAPSRIPQPTPPERKRRAWKAATGYALCVSLRELNSASRRSKNKATTYVIHKRPRSRRPSIPGHCSTGTDGQSSAGADIDGGHGHGGSASSYRRLQMCLRNAAGLGNPAQSKFHFECCRWQFARARHCRYVQRRRFESTQVTQNEPFGVLNCASYASLSSIRRLRSSTARS